MEGLPSPPVARGTVSDLTRRRRRERGEKRTLENPDLSGLVSDDSPAAQAGEGPFLSPHFD